MFLWLILNTDFLKTPYYAQNNDVFEADKNKKTITRIKEDGAFFVDDDDDDDDNDNNKKYANINNGVV